MESVFEAVVLLFLLMAAKRMLDLVDEALRTMRYDRHREAATCKKLQILESVLLYQQLNVHNWADVLVKLWNPVFGILKGFMVMAWVLKVLEFPVLSEWASGGIIGTLFAICLGSLFHLKGNILAAVVLARNRPFSVGDIITLQGHGVNRSAMAGIAVGFVEKVGIMYISIRNFDMRLQHVPTTMFSEGIILNWSERQYKLSHWTLVLSMRSAPESVKAFRDGVEHILRSHPTCKTDGYIKVCVGKLTDGGFELEIICFTKPHSDHHVFKLDMCMAFSKLASRLDIEFVWSGISRESANASVPGFQFSQADGGNPKADAEINDLLFKGRHTKGDLVGKFKHHKMFKLSKGFDQAPVDAPISLDLLFTMPLTDPAVVSDKAIRWTENSPILKGRLEIMVNEANLEAVLPGRSSFGLDSKVFVAATVVKKARKDEVGVGPGADDSAAAGDEVLACCKCPPHRLMKTGKVTWGETLVLGQVGLERPKEGSELQASVLQLVVGRTSLSGSVQVLGVVEKPLLELVQDAWKDQHVKVDLADSKENEEDAEDAAKIST